MYPKGGPSLQLGPTVEEGRRQSAKEAGFPGKGGESRAACTLVHTLTYTHTLTQRAITNGARVTEACRDTHRD